MCNGINTITIKTLHGSIEFKNQRFRDREGREVSGYVESAGEGLKHHCTRGLEELACRYARDTSYGKAVEVIKDVSGQEQLSSQTIHKLVADRAQQVSEEVGREARLQLSREKMPEVNPKVDLYAAEAKEVKLEIDAILVKEQKAIRDCKPKEKKSFVSTSVALLEKEDGSYAYLMGGVDDAAQNQVGLLETVQGRIIEEYGTSVKALNIVAINDGARDIRTLLFDIFGMTISIILDWYHLKKKVNEYMSMFGLPRSDKEAHIKDVLHCLWRGEVDNAMNTIKQIEVVDTRKKWKEELSAYLEKHRLEIINYEKRKGIGKSIGSGRMENGVKQTVGQRQKHKGMSWSKAGSKSLGILKVVQLNNKWDKLFFPERQVA